MIFTRKDGLSFELNNSDFTAKLINSPNAQGSILIPRSIEYQSVEYVITKIHIGSFKCNRNITTVKFSANSELRSIDKCAFYSSSLQSISIPRRVTFIGEHAFFLCYNLKEINFPEDSELRSIDKDIFTRSSLEKISIPPSVEKLKEGWCCGTSKLTRVVILEGSKYLKYADKERKMVVCKSNKSDTSFNVLVFVSRDVKSVTVPDSIERIGSFAFDECHHLKSIEFSEDSELKTIDKYAFFHSTLESIKLPPKVSRLNEGWCCSVPKLNHVLISSLNSNFIFYNSKIILGKSDENGLDYDVLVFACRDVKQVCIPSKIKRINSFAFDECDALKTIEFSEDSELASIGEGAFSCSSLEKISIPNHVRLICEETFSECKHLKCIEFSDYSELLSIDSKVFIGSSIESIFIPASVEELKEGWCSCTSKLNHVFLSSRNKRFSFIDQEHKMIAFKSDLNEDVYDVLSFACRDINKAVIPSNIKRISSFSFSRCMNLKVVEFLENSKLYMIDERAFSGSALKSILIPDSLNEIGEFAFCGCNNLQTIEFSDNSKFCVFDEGAFSWSSLKRISIPKLVNKISNAAFNNCNGLETIEILGDELILGQRCFDNCHNLVIVSLPNAKTVLVSILSFANFSSNTSLFIPGSANLCSLCS